MSGYWKYKMVGVVTLFQPDIAKAVSNIELYIRDIDRLIIWDNSPLELGLKELLLNHFADCCDKIVWHGNGENTYIAPAINYALEYAQKNDCDFVLTMDQDSRWDNFYSYRKAIQQDFERGLFRVYTPYIIGCDKWPIKSARHKRHLFINSGTVYPTEILSIIGGADLRFPLDALDHDLAIRVQEAGYEIVCLTNCVLHHSMGTPTKSKYIPLKANNYSAQRTYEITRSHILNYRKHKKWLGLSGTCRILKDFIVMRLVRIVLLEKDKRNRVRMLLKGVKDGMTIKL